MAPHVWRDVEELLEYLAANYPFDADEPFEAKAIALNAKLPGGDTPLHMAAAWDDVRGIELLVRAGAEIDEPGDMQYTPLATAVASGNIAAARALLKFGASPDARTEFGNTPYETAMQGSSEELKEVFRGGAI